MNDLQKTVNCITHISDKIFRNCLQSTKAKIGSMVAYWLMPQAPLGSNSVVSLSKAHLLPKSTGNTQEAVAPSQHD